MTGKLNNLIHIADRAGLYGIGDLAMEIMHAVEGTEKTLLIKALESLAPTGNAEIDQSIEAIAGGF